MIVPQSGVESMFIGEYLHGIDEKGRIIIPVRFREALGNRFIITKGLDQCLFIYTQAEWRAIEQKLKALPFTKGENRAFLRLFFSGAAECEMDRQGRCVLPPHLREYAGLTKDVVIIGVSSRVEIWSQERWEAYSQEAGKQYAQLAEKMEVTI